jgi:hypothetical protein
LPIDLLWRHVAGTTMDNAMAGGVRSRKTHFLRRLRYAGDGRSMCREVSPDFLKRLFVCAPQPKPAAGRTYVFHCAVRQAQLRVVFQAIQSQL